MTFDFPALIAHAARTRRLGAGSVIGSGTVSNRDAEGGPGRPIAEGGRGYSCIAEQRTVETLLHGAAKTPFLKRSEEHTSELQSLMRISYAVFCLKKKTHNKKNITRPLTTR